MLWGYFLKMVIADRAAIIVNAVYNDYASYGSWELIFATLLFAIQILCDFAGYSTIAIGAAKVMGFKLMKNFDAPYFSESIQEFWRRWHISLSTWFRDYLYFPLGGSRCSKGKHCRNILIVFIVSGLWHGASWNFIIWGFLHGFYQIFGIITKPTRLTIYQKLDFKTKAFSWHLGKILFTFTLVCFAWIFFRAQSVTQAVSIITAILTTFDIRTFSVKALLSLGLSIPQFLILGAAIVTMFLVNMLEHTKSTELDSLLMNQNIWFRWTVMFILIMTVFLFGVYGNEYVPQQFIYFQF